MTTPTARERTEALVPTATIVCDSEILAPMVARQVEALNRDREVWAAAITAAIAAAEEAVWERACAAVCQGCRFGWGVATDDDGIQIHKDGRKCLAHAIRRAKEGAK